MCQITVAVVVTALCVYITPLVSACVSCFQTMKARLRSFLGRPPVEPPPRWWQFSAATDGHHYMWRGAGPGRGSNIIAVCNPSTELWSLLPTTGPLPPGEEGGCSVCVGHYLYTFGGYDGSFHFNDMSKLDLDTLQWTKVQSSGSQPMKKAGYGLVRVNEKTLGCFGGRGIGGITQPGSTFTSGYTNEFHFFDTQNGNFCQRAHSLYVFITYTYRVSSYWWAESHTHSHRKPCSLSYQSML